MFDNECKYVLNVNVTIMSHAQKDTCLFTGALLQSINQTALSILVLDHNLAT